MPLTATVGRQDIIMGVGWLVLDGTPLDGSRTIYFDAARFTYDWAETNNKIDLIYVSQSAESDRWLEPICDQDRAVTEQDENGAILYLTNTSFKPIQLEGFFIYRNDNPIDQPVTNIPNAWSRKADIYTFGGAISGTQGDHWKYRAEGAIQTGEKSVPTADLSIGDMQDLEAFGALTNLEYLFKDSRQNATHVGYEYASGDDPGSSDNEQFDLLWGEWPRWSELLIYTAAFETTPAELTNLHRVNIGHRFNLNKQWTITGDYHALWADDHGDLGAVRHLRRPQVPRPPVHGLGQVQVQRSVVSGTCWASTSFPATTTSSRPTTMPSSSGSTSSTSSNRGVVRDSSGGKSSDSPAGFS